MKDEKALWQYIKNQMGNIWDAQRHEDKITLGIPDVSFGANGINGWMELKHVKKYPVKLKSPIIIRHFTNYQKLWLERRQKYAGNCWLLIRIEEDFYLFEGNKIRLVGVSMHKDDFMRECYSSRTNINKHFANWLYNCLFCHIP